jgi:adenine-specific DNA methylase
MLALSESLATNCMFCPYATDYRRLAGLFAIHGYMYVSRPVELNPWLRSVGRGTLENCVAKVRRAVESAPPNHSGQVRIVNGSSEKLDGVKDRSVDIVLTDPPFYHDSLDYTQLAAFYTAWTDNLNPLGIERGSGSPLQSDDGISTFANRLGNVFQECRRVLKTGGIMAFTFAHARSTGWKALEEAIAAADLSVTAVIPVESEGSHGFHNHAGNLKWNGLFVCRPRSASRVFEDRAMKNAIKLDGVSEADRKNLGRALAVGTSLSSR